MVHQCLREKYSVRIHIGCIFGRFMNRPYLLLLTYYFLLQYRAPTYYILPITYYFNVSPLQFVKPYKP